MLSRGKEGLFTASAAEGFISGFGSLLPILAEIQHLNFFCHFLAQSVAITDCGSRFNVSYF